MGRRAYFAVTPGKTPPSRDVTEACCQRDFLSPLLVLTLFAPIERWLVLAACLRIGRHDYWLCALKVPNEAARSQPEFVAGCSLPSLPFLYFLCFSSPFLPFPSLPRLEAAPQSS